MLLVLVALAGFAAVAALAIVLLVRGARGGAGGGTNAPPSEPDGPSDGPSDGPTNGPIGPANDGPFKPGKPGKSLPAECKITGNVFGDNAPVSGGIKKQNVRATYHYYSPHYDTGTLACADIVWKWPNYSQKLLMYPWSAYCIGGREGWDPSRICGKCFRVKNRKTGAAVIIRAVDSGGCSGGAQNGLDLDPCAFNAIDTDGGGVRDGNMWVDVEEVRC